jgi:hypothetical protein
VILVAVLIALSAPTQAQQTPSSSPTALPDGLTTASLNGLFADAARMAAKDVPDSHLFGVSITNWPFGNYATQSPVLSVEFRFRKLSGNVSSYEWRSDTRQLRSKGETHIIIGAESCRCGPGLWSDMQKLQGLLSFGYARVAGTLTPDATSVWELNTNSLTYKCTWRLWFFHEGSNIGSFALEKTGPRTD